MHQTAAAGMIAPPGAKAAPVHSYQRARSVTPPPPHGYNERKCPPRPARPAKTSAIRRNRSMTELAGMKGKWKACREALEAEEEEEEEGAEARVGDDENTAPHPPTSGRARPRLFSRDAPQIDGNTSTSFFAFPLESSSVNETSATTKTAYYASLVAGGSNDAAQTSTSTSTAAAPLQTIRSLQSPTPGKGWIETKGPHPGLTTATSSTPSSASTDTTPRVESWQARRRMLGTRASRKVSSTELPSFAEAWKSARRSLELEELEEENASKWVGSKPQLFRAGVTTGAEPSG